MDFLVYCRIPQPSTKPNYNGAHRYARAVYRGTCSTPSSCLHARAEQTPAQGGHSPPIIMACTPTLGPYRVRFPPPTGEPASSTSHFAPRSEEHTSELQSRGHLVCRLLLEKKNKTSKT